MSHRLKFLLFLRYGDALAAIDRREGNIPVYGSNGPIGSHNAGNTLKPAIIVGRKGSHGKVTWAQCGGFCIDTALFVDRTSKDTAVPGLDRFETHNITIPNHDLPTQKAIADFLDRETARIDQLIKKKQRMVEILLERLAARLQFAVLGGAILSRNPEGDWLSGLPDDWQLIPLKHLVRIAGGATPSKERADYWIGPIPWVSPKDMKHDTISETLHSISELALANSPVSIIPEGAVLVVVRGMILARFVPVCNLGFAATINQDMKALMPRGNIISNHYLHRMLQGFQDVIMSFVDEAAHGTKTLRSERFFSLKFPMPPIEQQADLVVEYDKQKRWTDSTIEKTESSIDRLREFRSALITAAVTGQIDVSTWGKKGTTDRRLDQIGEATSA